MPRRRAIAADRAFINLRPELNEPLVKSAERVIQILEFFDDLQASATVVDIADWLDMPQSSTSALLRSLMTLGYLHYDPYARTYTPTNRVALLGSWVDDRLVREGPIIAMMHSITEQIGLATFLATRNKLHVQIIHVVHGPRTNVNATTGTGHLLVSACSGYALLSDMSDTEIARLAIATNAQMAGRMPPVHLRELLDKVATVRRDGYAFAVAARCQDYAAIAVPLRPTLGEPMIVGVGDLSERMADQRDGIVEVIKRAIDSLPQND